jgi:hypothetical protein
MIRLRRFSRVMSAAPRQGGPTVYHNSQSRRPGAIRQVYACRHHVWEIMSLESRHSTVGSTRFRINGVGTGPKPAAYPRALRGAIEITSSSINPTYLYQ